MRRRYMPQKGRNMGMLTQRIARLGSRTKRKIVVAMVPVMLLARSTVEM